MDEVKLFCLLQGETLNKTFRITIPRDKQISYLKKLIIPRCSDMLEGVADRHQSLLRLDCRRQ